MGIEKQIKQQARNSLKGAWVPSVAVLFVLCAFIILVIMIPRLFLLLIGGYNDEGYLINDSINSLSTLLPYSILQTLLIFFLSPIINGFFKYFYDLSNKGKVEFSNVFYFFFDIKRFFKSIVFNAVISCKTLINFIICLLPYFILKAIDYCFNIFADQTFNLVFFTILFSLGIAGGIILSLRYIMTEFVYVDNENRSLFYIFNRVLLIIYREHTKDMLLLVFSFILWIAFSFLVIPAIYVIPYFTESLATSSKWLIKLHEDGEVI